MIEDERYLRHRLVPGWDSARLWRSSVVIAGMGALGNEVARILAMSGVGHLVICDPDTVQESNLSRTVLFRPQDVGSPKVAAAARELSELAPRTRVDTRQAAHLSGIGLAELRTFDLVLSCLDSYYARVDLAGRCNLVRAGMLDAGTSPWGGEVRYYPRGGESCFACGLTADERMVRDDPWSCGTTATPAVVGAHASVAAVVGGLQALFAIRLLLRVRTPPHGLRIDPYGETSPLPLPARDLACSLHDPIQDADVQRLSLTDHDTVAALRAKLKPGETAYAWAEFPDPHNHGRPDIRLSKAPGRLRLKDLCVAPREILPVVNVKTEDIRYVELSGSSHSGGSTSEA